MISTAEIHRLAEAEGLRFDQVEKDYVIVHLLAGIALSAGEPPVWVFKGGTCLRHCYYEGYRYSEDLDFSSEAVRDRLEVLHRRLTAAARIVSERSGLEMRLKEPQSSQGEQQVEVPVEYSRGGLRRHGLPGVRVHVSFDEPVLHDVVVKGVQSRYPEIGPFQVASYSLEEIVAEKMRALLQHQDSWPRPRDVYDLWYVLCHRREQVGREQLRRLFVQKCHVKGINPDAGALTSLRMKEWNGANWQEQVAPMLAAAPDYERVWQEWSMICKELM